MTDWQPIKTAPKDGSDVLVFSKANGRRVARFQPFNHVEDLDWFIALEDGPSGGMYCHPTHWQPLPLPPAEQD